MKPQPFTRLRPHSLVPIVLTCEHASRRLPAESGLGAADRALLATHWGWDIGAWALTRALSLRLRTSAIGGRWSRLWVDLNRRVDDPTLVRRRAGEQVVPWNRRATAGELERRVLASHVPYHLELDRLILRRLLRGIRPLLFAVHSFTREYEGHVRRFDAGVLYEHERSLAVRFGDALARRGLSVRYNEPYSGMAGMMYAVDRHGSHHGLPCLELEIRQDLLFDRAGVARVERIVGPALADLLPWVNAGGGRRARAGSRRRTPAGAR